MTHKITTPEDLKALANGVPEHLRLKGWFVGKPSFGNIHLYADDFQGMGRQHLATFPAEKWYFGTLPEYMAACSPATVLALLAQLEGKPTDAAIERARELECVIADLTNECQELRAATSSRPPAVEDAGALKAEHIDAIQALGRDDPAVHAFLRLMRRDGLAWGDVLAQLVVHLAQDKAALTASLADEIGNRQPTKGANGLHAITKQIENGVHIGWTLSDGTTRYYSDPADAGALQAAAVARPTASGACSHADDDAVDRFAAALKIKLATSRSRGRGGWDDPEQCKADDLRQMLVENVAKGDPVDVGNFAMMLFNRQERSELVVSDNALQTMFDVQADSATANGAGDRKGGAA